MYSLKVSKDGTSIEIFMEVHSIPKDIVARLQGGCNKDIISRYNNLLANDYGPEIGEARASDYLEGILKGFLHMTLFGYIKTTTGKGCHSLYKRETK